MRGFAEAGESFKENFKHAGSAQSPEPLPYAVPVSELDRQRSPIDIVNREIDKRLEKATVVFRLVSASRQRILEDAERNRPVFLCDCR